MYRDCQVTDSGDVFEIQKDGSISKIGSIKESTTSGGDATSGRGASGWLWFFFFLVAIVAVVLGIKYYHSDEEINRYKESLSDINYVLRNDVSTEAQSFDGWWSSNHSGNSTSTHVYSIAANKGDEIKMSYYVSSEKDYDFLNIYVKKEGSSSQREVHRSGYNVYGTFSYTFPSAGTYKITVEYSKDHNGNQYGDYGGVYDIYLYRPIMDELLNMSQY